MFAQIKRILVGRPIATEHQHHERLSKTTALAVFSSDALSSVSYATEAILTILILGGSAALGLSLPIAAAIAMLLLIVGFSYRQTIKAYPQGGGGYIVTRDNLGDLPGLVAAGALLIDYVLTVAVSISAGVAAITSLATNWGFPSLRDHAVEIALVCILIVTITNLRGAKESGVIFSIPTYAFITGILSMIVVGIGHDLVFGAEPVTHSIDPDIPLTGEALSLWLILRAFAAGCTALTGIEAISDGVQAFKPPEARNAAITLTWMISLLVTMFLGITWLAYTHQAVPNEFTHETIVSQIARTIFGVGPVYVFIQVATALILVLAANTAFADFPRLASFLSRDRFLPRQFASRGDRLVFSNGILVLGMFSALLVVIFRANEIAMLPLYAVGVFTSFTLSQSGMVRRHLRLRQPGWLHSVMINGFGAILTAIVLVILMVTKFVHGAWMVITAIPILVLMFRAINLHYRRVAEQLSLSGAILPPELRRHTAIVLVSGIHRGVLPALQYARSIAPDNVTAVYVDLDPDATEKLRARWRDWGCDIPLVVLESPFRSLINPIVRYIEEVETRYGDDVITVILPEFVPARWWEHLLHNQTGLLIKTTLRLRGNVVTSVPYRLER
ncbi:amino acid permease [Chloroflexus islandicus]|uniref:Amino acid permease n=1 Tax=Chloroflexus islandicus TaxID=1707952 RepID=A0A178MFR1_9CHLR|nr:APC family permease [Chloroflexus islandicus]OAN47579.1 amino acid permease [Chloroflexus islandicus]